MPYFYYPYYGAGYGLTYLLVLAALVIGIITQVRMKSAFNKYSRIRTHRGITGRDAAQQILNENGITDVSIEAVDGNLSDHYDPRSKTLRLSNGVYDSDSVAALGVAAHEAGHAVQHAKGYRALAIRNSLVPVASIGSYAAIPLVLIGLFFSSMTTLIWVGIWLYVAVVLFQLITLPVEFNASKRAMTALESGAMLDSDEIVGARRVLSAAAMTYVAATIAAIFQLLRLLLFARNRD